MNCVRKCIVILGLVTLLACTRGCVNNYVRLSEDASEIIEIVSEDNHNFTEDSSQISALEDIQSEEDNDDSDETETGEHLFTFDLKNIPAYEGKPYYVLNDNHPLFCKDEIGTDVFSEYSELDTLGRCGAAFAIISQETIPEEERGQIGDIKPSGWHTVKYNDLIDGNYLYNRCHLIGYQLAGENADPKNLITGTRYFNVDGMLPFENAVYDYVSSSGNHVAYRVTPVFADDNLVASGVTMEAFSIEDDGSGLCFYVFVYNVQPGIEIDYLTGESEIAEEDKNNPEVKSEEVSEQIEINEEKDQNSEQTYVINTNSRKFHRPTCKSVEDMKEKNKKVTTESRDALIEQGYSPCKRCNP